MEAGRQRRAGLRNRDLARCHGQGFGRQWRRNDRELHGQRHQCRRRAHRHCAFQHDRFGIRPHRLGGGHAVGDRSGRRHAYLHPARRSGRQQQLLHAEDQWRWHGQCRPEKRARFRKLRRRLRSGGRRRRLLGSGDPAGDRDPVDRRSVQALLRADGKILYERCGKCRGRNRDRLYPGLRPVVHARFRRTDRQRWRPVLDHHARGWRRHPLLSHGQRSTGP